MTPRNVHISLVRHGQPLLLLDLNATGHFAADALR